MRTARFPSSGVGWADPSPVDVNLPPLETDLPPSPGPPEADYPLDVGHVTCDACWEANPGCGQTNTCENITLPQTSFVGGNNKERPLRNWKQHQLMVSNFSDFRKRWKRVTWTDLYGHGVEDVSDGAHQWVHTHRHETHRQRISAKKQP